MRENIFCRYAEIEGIDQAMRHLSQRTRYDSGMERAAEELEKNYDSYRGEFQRFFPDLQKEAALFLEQGRHRQWTGGE